MQVQSLGREDTLEERLAPHSGTVAWSIGLQKVGHNRSNSEHTHTHTHTHTQLLVAVCGIQFSDQLTEPQSPALGAWTTGPPGKSQCTLLQPCHFSLLITPYVLLKLSPFLPLQFMFPPRLLLLPPFLSTEHRGRLGTSPGPQEQVQSLYCHATQSTLSPAIDMNFPSSGMPLSLFLIKTVLLNLQLATESPGEFVKPQAAKNQLPTPPPPHPH